MSFPSNIITVPAFPELSPAAIPDILNSYVVPTLQALQVKVGANSSTDTNSLDYKVAHSGGGGSSIPAGTLAYGDISGNVTGDAAGILYDDADGVLEFPQAWSLSFADTAGGFAGLVAGGDSLDLVTSHSDHSDHVVFSVDMNNDAPVSHLAIPLHIEAAYLGDAIINFPAPGGTTGGFTLDYAADADGVISFYDDLGNTYLTLNTLDLTISPNGPSVTLGVPLNCPLSDPILGLPTEDDGYFASVTTKTYIIVNSSANIRQLASLWIQTSSGTCTVTFKINGTSITGMTNIAVSNVQGFHGGINGIDNVLTVADQLTMVVTAASSPVDLSFSIPGLTQ